MVHITALPDKNIPALCVIVLLTGGIGYALGWLSLQKAQGSILYGWAIHAAVNILSPIMVFYILVAQGYGVTKHKCWNANGIIIHFCQTSRIDPCCLTARTLLGDFTCILLDKPESNLDENLNIA